jgi:hypothetical protein
MNWWRMDLHLHTPASSDYLETGITYLDILQKAEQRGLDVIAFTDHNTVAGYRAMRQEIESLELLERLERLRPDEKRKLDEYRRLLVKILVLPGFEFTATFGFHILGIFSPKTRLRDIEHILLRLNVPPDKLDEGSGEVGATDDVLTAYEVIDDAGGIVIAAHVNSANGVAMRGLGFGGQTRIAYTQDHHLHALEVTDLEVRGRRTTAGFFNGSKPEYPRRMRSIQGSDAHRLRRDPNNPKLLGVGDRVTEVQLPEVTFEALRELFLGSEFTRTRPFRPMKEAFDPVQAAREEGASIVQAFHETVSRRGGRLYAVIADVAAMANTNGGTIYVGASASTKTPPSGVESPEKLVDMLESEIQRMMTPPLDVTIDVHETQGKKVIRITVPRGDDPPYAIEDNRIYLRDEAETSLAVRDEIVQLVRRGLGLAPAQAALASLDARPPAGPEAAAVTPEVAVSDAVATPPRTGVEVVDSEEREGVVYHTVRDLRNGNIVKNVTRKSARRLWHYAITQHETHPVDFNSVTWFGDLGLLGTSQRAGKTRYDLVQRMNGKLRVYYGVTDDGIHGEWKRVVGGDEE